MHKRQRSRESFGYVSGKKEGLQIIVFLYQHFPTNDFVFDGDDSYILFVGPSEATQARVSTSSGKNNRQNVGKYIQFYVNTVILFSRY